jgi:uncharacterized protein YutE (UPF0331/DUF86 family)
MPPLDKALLRQFLAELGQYLDELAQLTDTDLAVYQSDFIKRHAAEKLIELIVEIASDLNRHVLQSLGKTPPQTYFSTFDEMGQARILPKALSNRLAATTGLRNRLVHGYEKVDHVLVHHSLKPFLRDYRQYFVMMNDFLQ